MGLFGQPANVKPFLLAAVQNRSRVVNPRVTSARGLSVHVNSDGSETESSAPETRKKDSHSCTWATAMRPHMKVSTEETIEAVAFQRMNCAGLILPCLSLKSPAASTLERTTLICQSKKLLLRASPISSLLISGLGLVGSASALGRESVSITDGSAEFTCAPCSPEDTSASFLQPMTSNGSTASRATVSIGPRRPEMLSTATVCLRGGVTRTRYPRVGKTKYYVPMGPFQSRRPRWSPLWGASRQGQKARRSPRR